MKIEEYVQYDATGLADLVKKKEVSAEALLSVSRKRIEAVNKQVNAVVATRFKKAEAELKSLNKGGALYGVPFLAKNISQAIKGEEMTAGSSLLKGNITARDSYYIAKIRDAGFSLLGHTNTPEFGLKNVTEPKLYGATRLPSHLNYSPGGSSGGAASAVLSGMVPIAGASDGGGSIRIPASFSGLVGLKPTRGKMPVGPAVGRQWQGAAVDFVLTKTVRDTAQMMDQLQVYQPGAAFNAPLSDQSYTDLQHQPFTQKLKIAYTTKSPVGTPVSTCAKEAVEILVKTLIELGHDVVETDLPVDGLLVSQAYFMMNAGEINKVLRQLEQKLSRIIKKEELDPFTYALNETGKLVSAADYSMSLDVWDDASRLMAEFHQTYDVLLTPATADHAPEIGALAPDCSMIEKINNITSLNKEKRLALVYDMFLPSLTITPFTKLANLTGQPAISIPIGQNHHQLPIGCQLMAAKGREDILIGLSFLLEQMPLWRHPQVPLHIH